MYCLLLITIQNGTVWKGVDAKIIVGRNQYEYHAMYQSKDKSIGDENCCVMFLYPSPTCKYCLLWNSFLIRKPGFNHSY